MIFFQKYLPHTRQLYTWVNHSTCQLLRMNEFELSLHVNKVQGRYFTENKQCILECFGNKKQEWLLFYGYQKTYPKKNRICRIPNLVISLWRTKVQHFPAVLTLCSITSWYLELRFFNVMDVWVWLDVSSPGISLFVTQRF